VVQKSNGIVDALDIEEVRNLGAQHQGPRGLLDEMGVLPRAASTRGVTVLALCGGLLGEAAALLASGYKIAQVFYCDVDETAAAVATHHWAALVARFPSQVMPGAERLNRLLPQDLRLIQPQQLIDYGLTTTKYLAVFCGWPCQGRSMAGLQLGDVDPRSLVVDELQRVLGVLQRLRMGTLGTRPLAYFLENVAPGQAASAAVQRDHQHVLRSFGQPLFLDAAQFDAFSHRERCLWTNLGNVPVLRAALAKWQRDPGLFAQAALEPGRIASAASCTDGIGSGFRYSCNVAGQMLRAFPTLVCTEKSYAFRGERDGVLLDMNVIDPVTGQAQRSEPNVNECEAILGYLPGATAAPGLSAVQRRAVLGNAFDQNTLVAVLAIGRRLAARRLAHRAATAAALAAAVQGDPDAAGMTEQELQDAAPHIQVLLTSLTVCWADTCAAAAEPAAPSAAGMRPAAGGGEAEQFSADSKTFDDSAEEKRRVPLEYDWGIGETDLPPELHVKFRDMLRRNDSAFSLGKEDLGCMNHKKFNVGVNPDTGSVWTQKRRLPEMHEQELRNVVAELTKFGFVIEAPDDCRFASPVLMVPKRDNLGKITLLRMCVDYRNVNEHTPPDRYPMPLPEDLFNKTAGWNLYSSGDLLAGFNQTEVAAEDQPKTAFHGPYGLLMYTRAPFGLKRMPNWFQREMEFIVQDTGLVFVDDLLTGNDILPDYSNFDQHIATVEKMLQRLIKYGVTLSPPKCHWAKRAVKFLAHTLSGGTVKMDRGKVDAMLAIPKPTNVTELTSWVFTVAYYGKLIDHHSARAEPLRRLLAKGVPFEWGPEQEAAWLDLRSALTSEPVLALPKRDLPFVLSTDWSAQGLSAILSQVHPDGQERVVAYASRSNSVSERNYTSYKGEMLAAVWGVEHFQYWLTGRKFKLVTDHQPLAFLMKSNKLSGLYYRWACRLSEFDLEIVYRPGTANQADLPSRFPMPDSDEDWENFKSDVDYLYSERPVAALAHVLQLQLVSGGAPLAVADVYEPELHAVIEIALNAGGSRAALLNSLAQDSEQQYLDVWDDSVSMQWLQHKIFADDTSRSERHRIRRRCSKYEWSEATGQLFYVQQHQRRLVPRPDQRRDLVMQAHADLGHVAMRRLASALYVAYWWNNLMGLAADVCGSCLPCQQANATFTAKHPELRTLAVTCPFWRVHTDLAGPFEPAHDGSTYIMVMVDSFTKWLHLEAIKDKSAASTMAVLRDRWVCQFGAPVELLMDNGPEWEGEFEDFCEKAGIRRKFTSPGRPQANGMAERMVQVCKKSLRRYVAALTDVTQWSSKLQFIAMSYRFTVQGSIRMSPYRLVFGRDPALPFRTREVFEQVGDGLDDNPVTHAVALVRKVHALQRMTPKPMGNLENAAAADREDYRMKRTGNYKPKAWYWQGGELAFLDRRTVGANFMSQASPGVYRVVQKRPSGVLVLQGRCGGTFREHGERFGPCLARHMDGSIDPALAKARFDNSDKSVLHCEECYSQQSSADTDRAAPVMLICECCYTGWHLSCVGLESVPDGNWYCRYCVDFRGFVNEPAATAAAALVGADALEDRLNEMMPGPGGWPRSTATSWAKFLPGGPMFLQAATGRPECVITLPEEFDVLKRCVRWSEFSAVVDPFAGTGTTRRVLGPYTGLPVVLGDVWPLMPEVQFSDALNASDLHRLVSGCEPESFVFVTSPWYKFNDLALPLMMACKPAAVFAHVSPWYVTDAHERRRLWLQGYEVHLLCNAKAGELGRRCTWLCVFPRGGTKKRCLIVGDAAVTMSW
jgi:hypothetical protein